MQEFESQGWTVTCLSRRDPETVGMYKLGPRTTHISLDLQDRPACEEALGSLTDVTHVVYSALYETPTSEGGILGGWGRNTDERGHLE